MSLYVVHKRNPYFRTGTYLESFEGGFQKAIVETKNHRIHVVDNEGLLIDQSLLMPYVMRILNKGLDKPSLRRKSIH